MVCAARVVKHEVVLLPGAPVVGLREEVADDKAAQGRSQQGDVQHRQPAGRGQGLGKEPPPGHPGSE